MHISPNVTIDVHHLTTDGCNRSFKHRPSFRDFSQSGRSNHPVSPLVFKDQLHLEAVRWCTGCSDSFGDISTRSCGSSHCNQNNNPRDHDEQATFWAECGLPDRAVRSPRSVTMNCYNAPCFNLPNCTVLHRSLNNFRIAPCGRGRYALLGWHALFTHSFLFVEWKFLQCLTTTQKAYPIGGGSLVIMPNTKTVKVPHLFGTVAAYQMPRPYDPSKQICVLVNSFTMTSDLYSAQFRNKKLLDTMNIIAIEPYGHGQTRAGSDTFTYWDTSIMIFQVLDALGIKGKVFALGTSQGGWIVVRMALLQPKRVMGIVLLGTSMDSESDRTRKLGNFDAIKTLTPLLKALESRDPTPNFVMPADFRRFPIYTGFGKGIDQATVNFWWNEYAINYRGDEGRKRLKECTINLRDRDGLHSRLSEVRCPVHWMHGTKDEAYTVANAQEEIRLFVNALDARLMVVDGGQHYLSASHPEIVDQALIYFVRKYS